MEIKKIMHAPAKEIKKNASIQEAMQEMYLQRVTSLIVEDQGIITRKDIIHKIIAKNQNPKEINVEEVMSSPLLTIPAHTPVEECARIMQKTGLRHLPVTEKDKITGIVTNSEILKADGRKN
ncbi:MAG: inosine-5-monophosphate dehydrogenase [Candidatus Altiarchaeales archaeon ex4484_2]|nr:MAG: inosine-5-monophosphate dehydrogenase [Candidatus Altiarchaeales archaeon ex4484_2]